jgi:biopolymer transport protein ExbB/TolQ
VLTVSDAQVWTVIGLFAAGMSALIAMTLRIVSVEISSLRHEIEHMNRDIQAIARRVFPDQ